MSKMTFTCMAGETYDSIARLLYGDESKSVALMEANPDKCLITVFDGGEVIALPDDMDITFGKKEKERAVHPSASAPWRE